MNVDQNASVCYWTGQQPIRPMIPEMRKSRMYHNLKQKHASIMSGVKAILIGSLSRKLS